MHCYGVTSNKNIRIRGFSLLDCDQFTEKKVQKKFDIVSTRINFERYIGRKVRDSRILNRVWNLNQLDLLGSNIVSHDSQFNHGTHWT